MHATIPGLNQTRDLLLVVAVAAVMTGASAIASGLNTPDGASPSGTLVKIITEPVQPPAISERPVRVLSDGDRPVRSLRFPAQPILESPDLWPLVLSVPEPSRPVEAGSFGVWARAEADPRFILARMASLSRHAPRSYASEPMWGGADRESG